MKAIIFERYGSPDVLELRDAAKPVPVAGEVLVRIRAVSANPADLYFLSGVPYLLRLAGGLFRPKINGLGGDLAGQVEAVGDNVTRFRQGDEVFGDIGEKSYRSFAEYALAPEGWLELKPANQTFEEAAAVPLAGVTALQGLRDHGKIQAGQKVLIIGAAGGVGTFAVQLAKWFGAEVTGVCSTAKVDLVHSIGADHIIDYTQEDFLATGKRFDLILQLAGTQSAADCRRALTPTGTLVLSSGEGGGPWFGPVGRIVKALLLANFVSQRIVTFVTRKNAEDLRLMKELIEDGKLSPVIDKTYQLSEAAKAIGYLKEGHARGKVVLTI